MMNNVGDLLSLGLVAGVFAKMLPAIAAILTIVWTAIRIYEWYRHRVLKKDRDGEFE